MQLILGIRNKRDSRGRFCINCLIVGYMTTNECMSYHTSNRHVFPLSVGLQLNETLIQSNIHFTGNDHILIWTAEASHIKFIYSYQYTLPKYKYYNSFKKLCLCLCCCLHVLSTLPPVGFQQTLLVCADKAGRFRRSLWCADEST